MSPPRLEVRDDPDRLAQAVADALVGRLTLAGTHHIALTGGGMGTRVLEAVAAASASVDWSRVHLWWGDERFLPDGHPDRNETSARVALVDRIAIPRSHVHPMPADTGQGADAAAIAYADELARGSDSGFVPDFDVVLLGMGPDGHVASLFPRSHALRSAGSVVAVHGSPKPPPTRVSLTLPAIRAASEVWIVAAGAAKAASASAAADPHTDVEDIPAAGARGRLDTVMWLDRSAAEQAAGAQD
jgi:6-phosphogluconolactonase